MEEAAYGKEHAFFHSLVFLLEPNQVFLAVAILLLLIDGGGNQEGLAEFNQKLRW